MLPSVALVLFAIVTANLLWVLITARPAKSDAGNSLQFDSIGIFPDGKISLQVFECILNSRLKTPRVLFLSFFIVLVPSLQADAQSPGPQPLEKTSPTRIRKQVTIDPKLGQRWQGYGTLENIIAGQEYVVELEIENRTGDPLKFAAVKPDCVCYDFKLDERSVDHGNKMSASIKFRCPSAVKDTESGVFLTFLNEAKEDIGRVGLVYQIGGNLFVEAPYSVKLNQKGLTEFLMPVIYTDPVKFESLILSGQETFESLDLQATLVKNDEGTFIKITSGASNRDGNSISGELLLEDKESKRKIKVPLLIVEQTPIEISPLFIHFRTGKDGVARAQALIKVNISAEDDIAAADDEKNVPKEKKVAGIGKLVVDADVSGTKISTDVSELTHNIYRVRLTAPETLLPSTSKVKTMQIRIKWKDLDQLIQTDFFVEKE
jgi:hypothetical protein